MPDRGWVLLWVQVGGCRWVGWWVGVPEVCGRFANLFEPFNTSLELFVPLYSKMGDNNNNNNKQQQNKEYEVAEKRVSAT